MTKKRFFNLRNVVAIAICLAGVTMFSSCDKDNAPTAVEKEGGVVINNVCWAKCNVGALGTFVANPEDFGMFYQWNRPKAYDASTEGTVTGWNSTNPTGTKWERANDPSPAGWRVPTKAEIDKLFDESKVNRKWVSDGVKGYLFTDKATGKSIFLPAAGYRSENDGLLLRGGSGHYWSSTESSGTYNWVHTFFFYYDFDGQSISNEKTKGYSIRPVAE